MKKFIISVYNGMNRYAAPSFYVDASNKAEATKAARNKSGLGRFKDWQFRATEIKERIKNKGRFNKMAA